MRSPGRAASTLAGFCSIGLLALAVRLAFALAFASTPLGSLIYLDSRNYENLALALIGGKGPALEPFFVDPLYAYLLAAIYRFFGHGLWPVRVLQIVGGAASAMLVCALARRLYGPRSGWIAGTAAALYGPLVFYDAMLLKTSGEVLMSALLLLLLVGCVQRSEPTRIFRWVTIGLVLGIAILLKANFLVLLPVVLCAPFLVHVGGLRTPLVRSAAAGLICAMVLMPILVRNTLLAGELTFLTNGAGMNFYQGNREGTDGGLVIPTFIRMEPMLEQADSLAEAQRRLGDPDLSAAGASRFWFKEALRFIDQHPLAWLQLMGHKTLLFWNRYEAADNLSFHYTRQVVPWLWLAPLGYWLVAPLGLAGALVGGAGGRPEWLLRAAVFLTMLGTVLFHVADRYRLAAVPPLIVLGIGFVRRTALQWQEGRHRVVVPRVALVLGAALLVNVPDFYPGGQDMSTFDHIMAMGYIRQGDEARAAPYAERAAKVLFNLGMRTLASGANRRAETYFLQMVDLRPDWPGLWYHLGMAEEGLEESERAAQAYSREPKDSPFGVPALTRHAHLLLKSGQVDASERLLLEAREVSPHDPLVLVGLGDLRAVQGRLEEAVDLFEDALEIDPGAEPVERRLAVARAQLAPAQSP